MSDLPDLLKEFQRRMSSVQLKPGASAEVLLEVMDAIAARLLKLAAIPHQFDTELLQILAPDLPHEEIKRYCTDFSKLSFISTNGDGWSLNNTVRQYFFLQWLKSQLTEEFADVSARLAAFFKRQVEVSQGESAETARRRYMFHLLGANQEAGFQEFEILLRRARHNRLYSECSQLLQLLHEYDGFLKTPIPLWLTYHEAKLSADLHNLEEAEVGFQNVLKDPNSPPELCSAAYVRLGYIHNHRHDWDEAIRCYERALELAKNTKDAHHSLPRILHDLGAAYREKGELDHAESLLTQSIELAHNTHNIANEALAYNSLGTLALKRRDVHAAINAFEKSLDALQCNNELFRTAQVYNNLGLAYADLPDWVRSDEYYRKSLEIKLKAGDTLGQAIALNNLASVQANLGNLMTAIESYTRAITLFTEMRDFYDTAVAKYNRGKLFRRMKKVENARKDFTEALASFQELKKTTDESAVIRDLENLDKGEKFPWWIIFIAMLLLIIILSLL